MPKLAPLPKSKAKNAYDLLGEVIEAIIEEPQRINMEDWIRRGKNLRYFLKDKSFYEEKIKGPACGTVACIGGWLVTMATGKPANRRTAEKTAHRILGSGYYSESAYKEGETLQQETERLNFDMAVDMLFTDGGSWPDAAYGTPKYAKHVAKNIREFRKKYRRRLLATSVSKRKAVKKVRVTA